MIDAIVKHKSKIAYLLVGGWNTLLGYGVFALLYYYFSDRLSYAVILTISYVISITNAYLGYKFFVFKTKGGFIKEYFRFYVVYGGTYLANMVAFPVAIKYMGVNPYAAQVIITFIIMVVSYISHKKFSFG
ncbi:MAG: GtrA family protein [Chlorobaculum sp.]|nr:GtrA family protein [Chlorobaculum sp.]